MIKRIMRTVATAAIALGVIAGLGGTAAHAATGDPSQWSVTGDPSQWG
ncbi:hypothetical protein N5079_26465 [Planotetraspora sp. A-T 1434]|nr:hypothetical protein [Planotetraspora sp. A-T 1434]MCT9933762.1 hypothetical protein [Planotetraspora sp. A-T 1434]